MGLNLLHFLLLFSTWHFCEVESGVVSKLVRCTAAQLDREHKAHAGVDAVLQSTIQDRVPLQKNFSSSSRSSFARFAALRKQHAITMEETSKLVVAKDMKLALTTKVA